MRRVVSVPSKSRGLKRTPHPHDKHNVGVRGLPPDDAFLALEICGTPDFDGALTTRPAQLAVVSVGSGMGVPPMICHGQEKL